jgi:hypothetical protein
MAEDSEVLALNGVQNLLAAATEELYVNRQLLVYFSNQRKAAIEPLAGARDFKLHHFAKCGRVEIVRQICF